MALSDKTAEADEPPSERARRDAADLPARLAALSSRLRAAYDTRPASRAEWDAARGEPDASVAGDLPPRP